MMVKGMRKAKTSGDEVAAADLRRPRASSSLGVRITRAKSSMAIKKKSSSSLFEDMSSEKKGDDGCYLQLRSRRLEWRVVKRAKKNKCSKEKKPKANKGIATSNKKNGKNAEDEEKQVNKIKNEGEGSFEDNDELENKERFERESTPIDCIIRWEDIPKSPPPPPLKRPSKMLKSTIKFEDLKGVITPSDEEIENFFSSLEDQMVEDGVKKFIEEYNFDPVNEKPLKGRYEWVEVTP